MPNEFDPDAAADALRATDGFTSEERRRSEIAKLTAAALIDVAASLQILAAEAWAAMPHEPEPVDELDVDDETRDFLVIGDLVTVKGDTEPGEVRRVGVDQGEPYADVVFANGTDSRYYARNLTRLVGDAAADAEINDAVEASLAAIADEPGETLAVTDPPADPIAELATLRALLGEPTKSKKGKKA